MSLTSGLIPLVGASSPSHAAAERPKTAPAVESEPFDEELAALIDPLASSKSTTKKKKKKSAASTTKKSKHTKSRSQSSDHQDLDLDLDLDDVTPKVGIEIKPASLELPDLNFEDSFEFLSTRTHRSTSRLSSNAETDAAEQQAEAVNDDDNDNSNDNNNSPSAASKDHNYSSSFLTAASSPRNTTTTAPSNPSRLETRKPAVRVDTTSPSAAAGDDEDEFGGTNIEDLLPASTTTPVATTTSEPANTITTAATRRATDTSPAAEKSPDTSARQIATSSIQLPPEAQDGDDYLPSFLSSSSSSRPRSRRARTARASSTRSFSFDQSSVHSEPTPRAVPDPFGFLDSPSWNSTTAADRREYFATSRAASTGDQNDHGSDDSDRGNPSLAKTAPAGSIGLATIHEHSSIDLAATAPAPQPRAKPIVGAFITSAADELQSPVRERPQAQAQAEHQQPPLPQYRPNTAPSLTTIERPTESSTTPSQLPREAAQAAATSPERHRRHQSEPASQPAWLLSESSHAGDNNAAVPARAFNLTQPISSPVQSPQRQQLQAFVSPAADNTGALSAALAEQKALSEQLAELRQTCDKLLREKAETLQAQEKEQIRLKVEQDNALAKQQQLHEQAMLTLQEQHKAVVEALKRVHEDEMATLKTHAQDAQVLDSLAHQIKMSAGTLKLLETQVSAGYRGLDATREGQLEARERLLRDMEASAKDMQKQAESEGYKLNGYLQSMEHLLRSLRSQHVEERERLRLEHLRLEDLQQAVRAESEENRRQLEEEKFAVQERAKALAAERRDWLVERDMWRREFQSKEAAFERMKEEFARASAQTSKQLEDMKKQQEEEQIKFERQRRQLEEDIAAFEQAKAAAAHQLEIAAKVQADLALKESEVMKERVRLSKFAEDVHTLSNQVAERSALAEQQIVAARQAEELAQQQLLQLRAREEQLRVSEQALQSLARKLESDRLLLVQQKTESLRARAPMFGVTSGTATTATMNTFQRASSSSTPFTQSELPRPSSMMTLLRNQHDIPLRYSTASDSLPPSTTSPTPINDYSLGSDHQLKQATSYLQSVKVDLQRLHRARQSTHLFLETESQFLSKPGRE